MMPLRIGIKARYAHATIICEYDPQENRSIVVGFQGSNRIITALRKHLEKPQAQALPSSEVAFSDGDWESLRVETAMTGATPTDEYLQICRRFAPLLRHITIYGNALEGLRTGHGQFQLSVEGIDEWFWNDSAEEMVVGTGPYSL